MLREVGDQMKILGANIVKVVDLKGMRIERDFKGVKGVFKGCHR